MWRVWRNWWVEILVGIFLILAVFLLLERMSIRQTLLGWATALAHGSQQLVAQVAAAIVARIQATTLSDTIGYCLIAVVLGLIVWRTRQRLMTLPRFSEEKCPDCGSELHRIHRHWPDRVLNTFIPVRRYQCKDHACGWRGLRVHRSHHI